MAGHFSLPLPCFDIKKAPLCIILFGKQEAVNDNKLIFKRRYKEIQPKRDCCLTGYIQANP